MRNIAVAWLTACDRDIHYSSPATALDPDCILYTPAKDKTPSWFLEHYAKKPQFEPQGVFFITKRSDVLGTCFAWNDGGESAKTIGQLHWLGVAPDHRGRGIAKCLIRLVLGYHKRMGRTQVWLSTESFRKDAIALYEREGACQCSVWAVCGDISAPPVCVASQADRRLPPLAARPSTRCDAAAALCRLSRCRRPTESGRHWWRRR